MMRIVGGEARRRIIRMPAGVKVRPTQDRVREAVFNVIREVVPGARALDLYAGSGAFGIEAVSRGAESSIFVDNNIKCVRAIKSNISVLGDRAGGCGVFKSDALEAIENFKKDKRNFDLIFLDPPYYKDLAKNCLIKIDACVILAKRGFVIVEHFRKDVLPDEFSNLELFKKRRYGDTIISIFRYK